MTGGGGVGGINGSARNSSAACSATLRSWDSVSIAASLTSGAVVNGASGISARFRKVLFSAVVSFGKGIPPTSGRCTQAVAANPNNATIICFTTRYLLPCDTEAYNSRDYTLPSVADFLFGAILAFRCSAEDPIFCRC